MWVTITHTQQHTYSRSHYEKQWEKEIEEVSLTKLSKVCVCVCVIIIIMQITKALIQSKAEQLVP